MTEVDVGSSILDIMIGGNHLVRHQFRGIVSRTRELTLIISQTALIKRDFAAFHLVQAALTLILVQKLRVSRAFVSYEANFAGFYLVRGANSFNCSHFHHLMWIVILMWLLTRIDTFYVYFDDVSALKYVDECSINDGWKSGSFLRPFDWNWLEFVPLS